MTHRIYFAQHGLALDKADNPQRPLSPAGVEQTAAIASHLCDSRVSVDTIFHSGKLRAEQTAEIFVRSLKTGATSTIDMLSPNDDVTLLAQSLADDHALYVGHLPHLEKLLAYLLTGDENRHIIKFQNSAVACLEKENAHYRLRWYITPELIRASFQRA